MPPLLAASCCSALLAVLGNQTSFADSSVYNASLISYFSAQEAEIHPSCIVHPAAAADVSSAVLQLTRLDCDFAVRGGGHSVWPGDANIADGVTIDLRSLNNVVIHQHNSTISVSGGSVWGDVYRFIEASQLVIPGGRVGSVGVGGLTTGGGLSSFSPRFGWTCDNVASMEVVLASGAIVQADNWQNTDLLEALRGGSNNFGIVTRFDFQAYPQGNMWGGTVNYDSSTLPQQLNVLSQLSLAHKYDEFSSIAMNIVYNADGTLSVQNGLYYTKAVEYPEFLRPLTDIPSTSNTLRIANISNFADEGTAGSPDGLRDLLATTTHGASLDMLKVSFNAWKKNTAAFAGTSLLQARLYLEPYPAAAYTKTAAANTNVLGLAGDRGTLVVVGIAAAWAESSDDALMNQIAENMVADIDAAAKSLGQHYDWKYLNYASPWQNVTQSYGAANVKRMRHVSKKYDPSGVFQKNVPGGFKLA
ncbi:hypothetical protein F5Y19DRAFT_483234 [Xylariaceae sp. FL1651]|nr:hypothetical protein F5Y19DRAFT_483234 [Xylariaceae sp. FL1651]